jgi:hypothetical protein
MMCHPAGIYAVAGTAITIIVISSPDIIGRRNLNYPYYLRFLTPDKSGIRNDRVETTKILICHASLHRRDDMIKIVFLATAQQYINLPTLKGCNMIDQGNALIKR